jgi:hypothetical protein
MRFPNITKMCMPAQVAAGAIVLTWLMGFASLATPAGRQATALDQEFYGTTDRIVLALAAAVGGIASLGMTTIAMNALCEQGYGILASVWSAFILFGVFALAATYANMYAVGRSGALGIAMQDLTRGGESRAKFKRQLKQTGRGGAHQRYSKI